jgi:hypothetical protein
MKRRWPYLLFFTVGGIALAMVAFAPAQEPLITIKNGSDAALSNVTVSGSGFLATIGDLSANESRQVAVYPRNESGVRVAFDVNGKHFEPGAVGYIESRGRYRLNLAVDSDFKLTVTTSFFGYQK